MTMKSCPHLHNCDTPITKDFFGRICNGPSHVNCHHFARKRGELRPPMAWLQKLAIQEAGMIQRLR